MKFKKLVKIEGNFKNKAGNFWKIVENPVLKKWRDFEKNPLKMAVKVFEKSSKILKEAREKALHCVSADRCP